MKKEKSYIGIHHQGGVILDYEQDESSFTFCFSRHPASLHFFHKMTKLCHFTDEKIQELEERIPDFEIEFIEVESSFLKDLWMEEPEFFEVFELQHFIYSENRLLI